MVASDRGIWRIEVISAFLVAMSVDSEEWWDTQNGGRVVGCVIGFVHGIRMALRHPEYAAAFADTADPERVKAEVYVVDQVVKNVPCVPGIGGEDNE